MNSFILINSRWTGGQKGGQKLPSHFKPFKRQCKYSYIAKDNQLRQSLIAQGILHISHYDKLTRLKIQ